LISAVPQSDIVSPLTSNRLIVFGQQCISSQLTNRDAQLVEAWDIMLETYLPSYNKPCLLVSGQMYGTGKTTLGLNLLNFSDPRVENVYKKYKHPFKEKLKKALFVTIDLALVEHELPPLPHEQDLQQYLGRIVWVESVEQLYAVSEERSLAFWARHQDPTVTVSSALKLLNRLINDQNDKDHRNILFHIDEVGAVFSDKNSSFDRF